MEFEIKDIERLYEFLDKFHDTFVSIEDCFKLLNTQLLSISKSLETIAVEAVEMGVKHETL